MNGYQKCCFTGILVSELIGYGIGNLVLSETVRVLSEKVLVIEIESGWRRDK